MNDIVPSIAGDAAPVAAAVRPSRPIGSLGRRLIAFIIDTVVIGLPAMLFAAPFFDPLSRLGAWGRVIGFFLALPYFAILNSRIGNGQTLGKRWMHIQVVDASGDTISVTKALLRYSVFAIPYFLNGAPFPVSRMPAVFFTLITVIIFGVGGSTFYLVCFNRRTRQGLHDLAAGSFVADGNVPGPLNAQPIWEMHWVILSVLLVVIGVSGVVLSGRLKAWTPMSQLLDDVAAVEEIPGVQSASVQDLTQWGGESKQKILVISARWAGKSEGVEPLANQIAASILARDKSAQSYDELSVNIIRGYDLGIANSHISRQYSHTVADWSALLSKQSPTGNHVDLMRE